MKNRTLSPIRFTTRNFAWLVAVAALPWSASGQVQPQPAWTRTVGNGYSSVGNVVVDAAGNVYVGGADENGYVTVKLSPAGSVLWSTPAAGRNGYHECSDIAVDGTGNVYVTGGLAGSRSFILTFCDFFTGCQDYRYNSPDLVTIKYDNRGRRQWEAAYFETDDRHFAGVDFAVAPAGDVYVVGYTFVYPQSVDVLYVTGTRTIKYDAAGRQVWVKTNSPISTWSLQRHGNLASLDRADNLCLTGASGTRKLDPNGNELWSAPIQGTVLQLDDADNLYVITDGVSGATTKLDPGGKVVWTAPFGGAAMTLDNTGNLFVADFRLRPGRADYVTTKLDRRGQPIWRALNDTTGDNEYPTAVATDNAGNVYVTGNGGTVKYDTNGIRIWQVPPYGDLRIALDEVGNVIVAGGTGDGLVVTKFTQTIVPGAPVITTPPHHPLVRAGDTVALSVSVTGDSPLMYQWRTVPGLIPGPTNATLTLSNVQINHAGLYAVEVTNHLGSAAAPGIFVNLLHPLPSQTDLVLGATAIFTTPLSGGGPAAFQWQFNGVNLPGENNAALRVTNAVLAQAGDYTVVVSNYYGNALTSTVARLTVQTDVRQVWQDRFPGSGFPDLQSVAIKVDSQGNAYVTGASYGSSFNDYMTRKYNPEGVLIWSARYNGPGNNTDEGRGLAVDNDGNVYVTGGSYGGAATGFDIATVKYDAQGSQLWVARYDGPGSGEDLAFGLAVDDSGNVYAAGYSTGSGSGYDYATIKYGPDGSQLWAARYNGPGNGTDIANAIAVDNAGNVYVTGYSYGGTTTTNDYATIKYDPNGTQLWVARYNGPGNGADFAFAIALDNAGNPHVTGRSIGAGTFSDYATIKYSTNGNQLWLARYNGPGNNNDVGVDLKLDSAGNVYVTGASYGGAASSFDYATVKYGPTGSQLWVARYNGPANGYDQATALALDNAGNVYVTGYSYGEAFSTNDIATIMYAPNGEPLWAAPYDGPAHLDDRGRAIAVDSFGGVYVAGESATSGRDEYVILKYLPNARPRLTFAADGGGGFFIRFTGFPDVTYRLQRAPSVTGPWSAIATSTAPASGLVEFHDVSPLPGQAFYRTLTP